MSPLFLFPFIFFFGFLVLMKVHFISSISSFVAEIGVLLPLWKDRKWLFLDIDGVLNSSKTIDRNFDYPELAMSK